eukprot:PhM_4_TR15682/c1_g1_i1/m.98054
MQSSNIAFHHQQQQQQFTHPRPRPAYNTYSNNMGRADVPAAKYTSPQLHPYNPHHRGDTEGGGGDTATAAKTSLSITDTQTKSVLQITNPAQQIWELTDGSRSIGIGETEHGDDDKHQQPRCQYPSRGHHDQHQHGPLKVCEPFVTAGGRHCPHGTHCPAVHVDPAVVQRHRAEVMAWLEEKEAQFDACGPHDVFRIFVPEVNEVCSVPAQHMAFTRGLYLEPEQRAKRGRGSGAINSLAATTCKLYAVHPSRCSWGRLCNQAHVSGRWVTQHCTAVRRWFREASERLESDVTSGSAGVVDCHDPITKRAVQIPTSAVAETTRGALQQYEKERASYHHGHGHMRLPSICMLYLTKGCTAGARCNQIHVASTYMAKLRDGTAVPTQPQQHEKEGNTDETDATSHRKSEEREDVDKHDDLATTTTTTTTASNSKSNSPYSTPQWRPHIPTTFSAPVTPPPPQFLPSASFASNTSVFSAMQLGPPGSEYTPSPGPATIPQQQQKHTSCTSPDAILSAFRDPASASGMSTMMMGFVLDDGSSCRQQQTADVRKEAGASNLNNSATTEDDDDDDAVVVLEDCFARALLDKDGDVSPSSKTSSPSPATMMAGSSSNNNKSSQQKTQQRRQNPNGHHGGGGGRTISYDSFRDVLP